MERYQPNLVISETIPQDANWVQRIISSVSQEAIKVLKFWSTTNISDTDLQTADSVSRMN
jgi:hypothetical protein